jgi:hypothetical protein
MERSTKLCASAAILVAGICGLTQATRAQDFPLAIGGILCDTEEEVRTIVSANQQSSDAMRAAFQQLNTQLSTRNQPACSLQQMPHTLLSVPESIDIGPWPEGDQVLEAFTLHIQFGSIDAWFMYLAPRSVSNGI